ncbi:General transcription factor II-I repeat domain-containing protein 2 [Eumeta japonica]|uniref:General transcription factor II-I repeat domain-containing protein 2 n=1 Tax=Eumeta variegata TaxID=151549 RepID=A0A4C1W0X7_EUMVA|nr:General transcription factor II-I repeat domain-containing protein 2 [Eumeta japonica]
MKEFNIKRHYSSKHPTLYSPAGQIRKDKFQNLIANLKKLQHKQRTQLDNVGKASFIVSSKLANSLKPFAEGEFVNECMLKVCSVLYPEKKNEFEKISLSRRTVVRRIVMMANDIKTTLTDRMAGFESFSIELDESTDLSDTDQLTIFIRGVDKEFTVTGELLALQPLKGSTIREAIFNKVEKSKAFVDEISAEYDDISYYCEVRCLSKGKMLKRFYGFRNEIADFMQINNKPLPELSDPKWICDLAFPVDITGYLKD